GDATVCRDLFGVSESRSVRENRYRGRGSTSAGNPVAEGGAERLHLVPHCGFGPPKRELPAVYRDQSGERVPGGALQRALFQNRSGLDSGFAGGGAPVAGFRRHAGSGRKRSRTNYQTISTRRVDSAGQQT